MEQKKSSRHFISYALYTALGQLRTLLSLPRNTICKFQRVPFAVTEVKVGEATRNLAAEAVASASCEHKY